MDEKTAARKRYYFVYQLTGLRLPLSAQVQPKAYDKTQQRIIKPALSRGEMQCVGATTLNVNIANTSRRTPFFARANRRFLNP